MMEGKKKKVKLCILHGVFHQTLQFCSSPKDGIACPEACSSASEGSVINLTRFTRFTRFSVVFATLLFFRKVTQSCNYMTSCCCATGCTLPWLPSSWRPHFLLSAYVPVSASHWVCVFLQYSNPHKDKIKVRRERSFNYSV